MHHVDAAKNPDPSAIAALLEAGVDVNARTKIRGEKLLHYAAWKNPNPAVITALIEAGADTAAYERDGWTPLHVAARHSNLAAVAALLEAGIDAGARSTKRGVTPLHNAARAENPSLAVIAALLEADADLAARDKADKIPFDYAKDNEKLRGTKVYWRLNEARFK